MRKRISDNLKEKQYFNFFSDMREYGPFWSAVWRRAARLYGVKHEPSPRIKEKLEKKR